MKYLDMSRTFRNRASEIDLSCKTSQRVCVELAKRLARVKAKTPDEFEHVEKMKQIVITTSAANEQMLEMLNYMRGLLLQVCDDAEALVDGANIRNKLEMQSETIEILMQQTRNIDELKDALRERNKGNSQ